MLWYQKLEMVFSVTVLFNSLAVIVFLLLIKQGNPKTRTLMSFLLLAIAVKVSYPLLMYFKDELGIIRRPLFALNRSAYFSFGPLLFLYLRSVVKQPLTPAWIIAMFLPALVPLVAVGFHFRVPLWTMQLDLLAFLVLSFIQLRKNDREKQEDRLYAADRQWYLSLFGSFVIIWLVANLLMIDSSLYLIELIMVFILLFYIDLVLAVKAYWLRKGDESEPQKYKNSRLSDKEEDEIVGLLISLMELEKAYLDPAVTLPKVAGAIGVKSYKVSQIINQKFNMTFNEYINSYRIADVKTALKQPENRDLKIACLAFDYGFNSISVFNTAFKKFEKSTPSQFREEMFMNSQN